RDRRLQEVQQIPAQDPVDADVGLREPLGEKAGQIAALALAAAPVDVGAKISSLALSVVPVDVGVEILDENLAPELLAEVRDVGPDDGAKVEQHGIRTARPRREELPHRLRGVHGSGTGGLRSILWPTPFRIPARAADPAE